MHAPRLLAGVDAAVDRLELARGRNEGVAVVGDYDADGVTATALLTAVLRSCGLKCEPVLPHRLREGYGFQPLHVERAQELGCTLIVTVDCGTSAFAGAARARAEGIDLIVTDHHLPGDELPEGVLLVNPRQPGCEYPFRDLAGVGLALKLAQAFAARCGRALDEHALLRIAAVGTIADMVPLVGENRVIAALGLASLAETRSVGLRALLRKARLRAPILAEDVGFRIGPRLNAAGRLGSADVALELLLARDGARAEELAERLEVWNRERQAEEQTVVHEARRQVEARSELPPILVAWSDGWHPGVVGIAAGRLARQFGRPTLLLAVREDLATGSGRSVPGIHLHEFIAASNANLVRFGGHAQAIGLTARVVELERLRVHWESAAASWPSELLEPRQRYDLEIAPPAIDREFVATLERLAPHGQGNPQPVLRVGPLRLQGEPRLFGQGHLSAKLAGGGVALELLGWGWGGRRGELAGPFEALVQLERDRRHGGVVLRGIDCRPMNQPSGG